MIDMLMCNKHAVQLVYADAYFLQSRCQRSAADTYINQKALLCCAYQSGIPLAATGQHHNLKVV